jgi:hypothetical protein
MVTKEDFSKVFGCSIEDVDKFCYDFFSAEDIDKAIEVLESFVDTHPAADISALRKLFIAED